TTEAINLWKLAPASEEPVFCHANSVAAVACSPDGKLLASAGRDAVRIWDVTTGKEVQSIPDSAVKSMKGKLAFSPDGKTLAIGYEGRIVLRNVADGSEILLKAHPQGVFDLAFSPDGNTVASVGPDGNAFLWDLVSHQQKLNIKPTAKGDGDSLWQTAVAFSPDGKMLAIGSQFGLVKLYDPDTGRERAMLERFELAVNQIWSLGFSPDGRSLAAGDALGIVRIWDLPGGHLRASLKGHTESVNSLGFSPDGRTLVTASRDNTCRLWDVATGQERLTLKGHGEGGVNSAVFFPDGATLVTGGHDHTVRLWRASVSPEARARKKEVDSSEPDTPAAHNELGDRLWQSDRTSEAETAYRTALARLEKLIAAFPDEPAYSQEMIRSLLSLSLLLERRGSSAEIEQARERARQLYRKLSIEQQDVLLFNYRTRRRKLSTGSPQQAKRTMSQLDGLIGHGDATLLRMGPEFLNDTAWRLVSDSDVAPDDAARAVELAKQAVALEPKSGPIWNTLGVARYRTGDWRQAIVELETATRFNKDGGTGFDFFFLAMAHHHLGEADAARRYHTQAVQWMTKHARQNKELLRFRAEAEQLLGSEAE
ncbi:MAG TPA: tetratricopeptide repeat protein, partial [Verrucomicrobiae bacterium]|nr:tetratricopeptide repeat protein [Verrucomicrobiae bacterium]